MKLALTTALAAASLALTAPIPAAEVIRAQAPAPAAVPTPIPAASAAPARTVSAWLPWWDTETGHRDALAHADQLHTVSPFWYTTTSETDVTAERGAGSREVIDTLHAKGVKVIPTLTETPGPAAMAALLQDPERRRAHVDTLVKLARSLPYDGLDLDYERMTETEDPALREQVRTGYNAFAAELCARLHALAKTCVITVMPRTATDGLAFDYPHLGKVADRLRIMGYNLHNALGEPGPLSSKAWYEEFTRYATTAVPREKLEVALPAYGWDWTIGSTARAKHVTTREAEALRKKVRAPYALDPVSGTPHFSYTAADGRRHEVWYQDANGSATHLEVLARYGVRNAGLWALGFEDPKLWDVLAHPYTP